MADERDKEQFDETEGKAGQQPTGQQGQPKQQRAEPTATGSEPPRSMGTKGTEFGQFGDASGSGQQGQSGTGQADLGSQADTTLAGRTDQQDLGQDQPGSVGGATGETGRPGEGFIGSSVKATEGEDFAPQGRGALEGEEEDIEGGQSRTPKSDIERE